MHARASDGAAARSPSDGASLLRKQEGFSTIADQELPSLPRRSPIGTPPTITSYHRAGSRCSPPFRPLRRDDRDPPEGRPRRETRNTRHWSSGPSAGSWSCSIASSTSGSSRKPLTTDDGKGIFRKIATSAGADTSNSPHRGDLASDLKFDPRDDARAVVARRAAKAGSNVQVASVAMPQDDPIAFHDVGFRDILGPRGGGGGSYWTETHAC